MIKDKNNEDIIWSNAGQRPTIFVFFHVTVVIPLALFPFMPSPYGFILVIVWLGLDIALQYFEYTLAGFFLRSRIWLSGGLRKVTNSRKQQKLRGSKGQ